MRCPKCQFDHELQTTECLKCGIVFARYQAALQAKQAAEEAKQSAPAAAVRLTQLATLPPVEAPWERYDPRNEFLCRALAIPIALVVGWYVAAGGLMAFGAGELAMVVHESGHAIAAWLTGRWAIPSVWVTYHGDERHWSIVLGLAGAIGLGGYLAWKAQRWGWVCAAGAALLLEFIIQAQSSLTQGALIVFGGDAGALVLGTILMTTFYAPHKSALYKKWGMRWILMVFGALAFMYVYREWATNNMQFGEIEGVNLTDPSLLTEYYGWSYADMVSRYLLLSRVCFLTLFALYVGGLVSVYRDMQSKIVRR